MDEETKRHVDDAVAKALGIDEHCDIELESLSRMVSALEILEPMARERVLSYLRSRYLGSHNV